MSLRALTTMAVKTSYPLTKEVWFSFKMIVVAKFKVNKKEKENLTDNHLLRNFFILAFSFLPFSLREQFRGFNANI